jgi:hypothetical protein
MPYFQTNPLPRNLVDVAEPRASVVNTKAQCRRVYGGFSCRVWSVSTISTMRAAFMRAVMRSTAIDTSVFLNRRIRLPSQWTSPRPVSRSSRHADSAAHDLKGDAQHALWGVERMLLAGAANTRPSRSLSMRPQTLCAGNSPFSPKINSSALASFAVMLSSR